MAPLAETAVERILRAAQAGDRSALNELIDLVRPRVFRWAAVQTGSIDEAEDVAQEVSLVLLRRLHRFRGGAFVPWLYRVTTNAARDARRKWPRRFEPVDADIGHRAAGDEPDALAGLLREELRAALARFMEDLSQRQRELLDLVDLQGYSAIEAAAMLGIDPATARVHLLRARRAMRARLIEETKHDL